MSEARDRLLEDGYSEEEIEKVYQKAKDQTAGQYGNHLPSVRQSRIYSKARELLKGLSK